MIIAVVNPVSGGGAAPDRLRFVREACGDRGRELKVLETQGPKDVLRLGREVIEEGPELVVLIGGDGSVGELARAYAEIPDARRPPVVLCPAGRGNSLYKALLSDAPWREYVRRALDASDVRSVDAVRVEETGDVWTLGFSLGYFHDTVEATRYFRGLRGRTLYAASGVFAALRLRPFGCEVRVDGRGVFSGRSVLVGMAGGPFRGGRLLLYPTSDLEDGLVDLVIVEDVTSKRFGEIMRMASSGEHVECEEVHVFQGEEVRIASDEMRCELDGTIYPYAGEAVTLRCLPGVLPVAFPRWRWEDLSPSASPAG